MQRSGGIDGTHGPLIGGGREGGGPSLAGGAPPPPGPRRVAAGAAVTGGPAAERQVCARFSLCDLNDRTLRVTSRRFVVNMVRPVTLHAGEPRGSPLHSCLSKSELRNYFSRKTRLLD